MVAAVEFFAREYLGDTWVVLAGWPTAGEKDRRKDRKKSGGCGTTRVAPILTCPPLALL